MLDSIEEREYVVPSPSGEPVATPESTAATLQANPPVDWTGFAAPIGLTVGIALLVAGGIAWWRRQAIG